MALGLISSFVAAARKFVGFDSENAASVLEPLHALAGPIRHARSEAELSAIEEQIDDIIREQLRSHPNGKNRAADAAALRPAAQRLERLIQYRRTILPPS